MIEEWKEIKGNREIYEISSFGNVRTKDRIGARGYYCKGHDIKQSVNSNGYLRVALNIDGQSKYYFVHRLVAENFLNKVSGKNFVNHIDGNKKNNKIDNLEWCTRSENEKHAWKNGLKNKDMVSHKGENHGMHKLTNEQVEFIRNNHKPYDKEFGSIPLALKFNVSPQTITDIVHNRTWIEDLPYSELITGEK